MKKNMLLMIFFLLISYTYSQVEEISYRILCANSKNVYIEKKGIYYLNKITKIWAKLPDFSDVIKKQWNKIKYYKDIFAIDSAGSLWVLLPKHLLYFSHLHEKWKLFSLPPAIKESQTFGNPVGIESWKDNIWISSETHLWCFHKSFGRQWWEKFPNPPKQHGGNIKKGPSGNLWLRGIASFNGKIWNVLPPCPIPIAFWKKSSQVFTWDKQKKPWLATVQGVYFFDYKYNCWRPAPGKRMKRAYSIAYFEGKIWCSNYNSGMYTLSDANTNWKRVSCSKPRPNLNYVYAIYSGDSRVWFDTFFGIGSYDGKKWLSHYDYTNYYRLHTSSLLGLIFVICLLLIGVVAFLLLGRIRRH